MKAVLMERFGGPDVLALTDVRDPTPQADEVLIKVHAVTVNRTLDLAVRAGRYGRPVNLPHVLGADPVGTVAAVGDAVSDRKIGDRVVTSPILRPASANQPPVLLGVSVWGGYAQYVCVPAVATHLVPEGLSFEDAAVIGRHAPLALHLLKSKAAVRPGETVLVMGATGGLGAVGVQIAKWLGATVIAGAGARARIERAIALGADHGIDYRAQDLQQEVMKLTEGRGVDVVFENIGDAELFPKAVASLARGGRLVTAGSHGGGIVPLNVTTLYQRQLTLYGSTGQTAADVEQVLRLGTDGLLRAEIAVSMPLGSAADAHDSLESGRVSGKILLLP
ncbi:NADPH:quinone reductase-like Zn-dependent oxidoreductase [Paraburkholderia sp. BL23I1N1]|uniref:zinc-binding dehydrogenase n=1 Tax=Paraburkholderia sp. BL23I1N1 TaxID=1938802 RepID=UPI000E70E4C9|nr:zinc-binding dehydrogenase [Paraburkholderia sp. BL23I1N1]RKE38629.1 NADPH:quinone reductase-like Zn-dependent oxidoreductase [Paraburkholderia sp. BL23I1N1]